LYAYYWRKRAILELQVLTQGLIRHRAAILHFQERLTRRVSKIDQAVGYLQQAAAALKTAPDGSVRPPSPSPLPPGSRPKGRPPRKRPPDSPTNGSAASGSLR
jgi:hypothetical protein